jgi:ADP-heptose:LPS heptosyltransferase
LFLDRLRVKNAGGGPGFPHLARRETTVRARQLGLIPIAPWAGKHWGPANWSQFIPLARAEGWQVTALCGPGQSEAAIRELGTGVELVESKSIRHWADTLQTCSALVTVDTGPMHLADALGIPLVALFGQGLLPLWAPSAPTSRILHHQSDPDFILCHPIQKNTLYAQRFMARIHPADVLKALEDFT